MSEHMLENRKWGLIVAGPDHLRIQSGKGESSDLHWGDIEEIHACKADLFTTDLIRLLFKKSGRDECFEIHEQMAGYHELVEALAKYLPGFGLDWFSDVAFPAFETNHRVIWRRSHKALRQ